MEDSNRQRLGAQRVRSNGLIRRPFLDVSSPCRCSQTGGKAGNKAGKPGPRRPGGSSTITIRGYSAAFFIDCAVGKPTAGPEARKDKVLVCYRAIVERRDGRSGRFGPVSQEGERLPQRSPHGNRFLERWTRTLDLGARRQSWVREPLQAKLTCVRNGRISMSWSGVWSRTRF